MNTISFERYSKLDQVNLLHQVTDWQKQSPDDYYAIKLATKVPQAEEIDHLSVEEKEIQKDDDPILSFFSAISQSFKDIYYKGKIRSLDMCGYPILIAVSLIQENIKI